MMRIDRNPRRRDRIRFGAGILLLSCALATPLRAEIVTRTIPTTTAHRFSSHPMIAGRVVTVNAHEMVVDTETGEPITLLMDARTLAPSDLAPGMTVRTEFAALENGRFRADQVIVVRQGMSRERLQAYADTPESRELTASNEALRTRFMRDQDATAYSATTASMTWRPRMVDRATSEAALPGTADYALSTERLLSGTVRSVNDHEVVLETDQGRKIAMVMDSRTMLPRDVMPGSVLRAQYKALPDGRYYVQRIRLLGVEAQYRAHASAAGAVVDAGIEGDRGSVTPTPGNATTSAVSPEPDRNGETHLDHSGTSDADGSADRRRGGDPTSLDRDRSRSSDQDDMAANSGEQGRQGTLPQTASGRPLFLLLGLLSLASAGAITYLRMRTA